MKSAEHWLKEVEDTNALWRASPQAMLAFFARIQEDARAEVLEALSAANRIIEQQADENKRTCARAWEEGRSATYKKFIETFIPDALK